MTKRSKFIVTVTLLACAFAAGGLATGTFVQHTSTTEFCTSCHEMTIVYEEYKKTVHFQSRTGVSAGCSDCHIPHDWGTTLIKKMLAAKDVFHHLMGTLDTPEKFEAHRQEMAESVWASMKASNSRECRNCHQFEAMALDKQRPRAHRQHQSALKTGETCIDCHKGIAHKPVHPPQPQDFDEILLEY